jgi:hypothetical protein
VAIYCLRSFLRLRILQLLYLNYNPYEKICFILNHSANRHRVYRFLHATTGNNGNFDDGGDHQGVTIAITA